MKRVFSLFLIISALIAFSCSDDATLSLIHISLGTYELFFGDYKKMFSAPDDYKKVTADDIKNVTAKYFTKQNRTVGILNTEEAQ